MLLDNRDCIKSIPELRTSCMHKIRYICRLVETAMGTAKFLVRLFIETNIVDAVKKVIRNITF